MKQRRASLRSRLLWTVLLPVLLLIVSIIALMSVRGQQMIRLGSIDRGLAIVSFLAPAAEYGLISANERSLDELLAAVMKQSGVAAALLQDGNGQVVAARGVFHLGSTPALESVHSAQVFSERGQFKSFAAPVLAPQIKVDEFAPAPSAETALHLGWVYVEIDNAQRLQELAEIVLTTSAFALVIIVLTSALGVRLANQVSRPLEALVGGVSRIAGGEREVEVVAEVASEELLVLQQGFNQMARALDQAHDERQARIDAATRLLAHQASHDPLTGLPNRRAFEEALRKLLDASQRASDQAVLCLIDLDGFKAVNDSAGHAAGDTLLCQVAELIRAQLRADDLVYRIGGDEFALILRACGSQDAQRITSKLCELVAGHEFVHLGQVFRIGLSIGFSTVNADILSAAELTRRADHACYAVKRQGRGFALEYQAEIRLSAKQESEHENS